VVLVILWEDGKLEAWQWPGEDERTHQVVLAQRDLRKRDRPDVECVATVFVPRCGTRRLMELEE
jgi:hypothetical protein